MGRADLDTRGARPRNSLVDGMAGTCSGVWLQGMRLKEKEKTRPKEVTECEVVEIRSIAVAHHRHFLSR